MLKCEKPNQPIKSSTLFVHSHIQTINGIHDNVVIENTTLGLQNSIGKNCIISNNIFPDDVIVPEGSFLHTVIIRDGGEPFYVTVGFGIEDNVKKCCGSHGDLAALCYAGMPLNNVVSGAGYTHVSILRCYLK